MKRLGLCLLLVVSGFFGCAKHYRDTALYHVTGKAKPVVAVLPIVNTSVEKTSAKWDVADELTQEIRNRCANSSRVFLLQQDNSVNVAQALITPEMKSIPRSAFESLAPAEFVVIAELINDEERLTTKNTKNKKPQPDETQMTICLAMRVRVVDLRGQEPKIVLQEVVSQDHEVARSYMFVDYKKTAYGTPGYDNTPLGMAHNKLVKEVVSHIEGYIGL